MSAPMGVQGRGGFSLVEALVAMVLVSVVVLALAPVMFTAATRQAVQAGGAGRDAAIIGEVNRLSTLSPGALTAEAGCRTLPAQAQPYSQELCVTVQPMGGGRFRVAVAVSPDSPMVPSDSVVFYRRAGGQGNPFNAP